MTHFPYFAAGNVKLVSKSNSVDQLKLQDKTLAKHSGFFKASLDKLEWSRNASHDVDAVVRLVKLLELELEGTEDFPVLIGKGVHASTGDR